jgi:hypothetical protein
MPAPGKKRIPPAVKDARGTRQPCRDGVDTREPGAPATSMAPAISLSPPELPLEVADVWAEYVAAAVANGARQCDAESFAEWCSMAALLRKARNATETDADGVVTSSPTPAPASYVAQFRMLGELFGLAGPGSRVVNRSVEAAKSNLFARNGRRN